MEREKIYIGNDHAGFDLKIHLMDFLISEGYEVEDVGTYDTNSCDYPDYAAVLCRKVIEDNAKGILVCSTGQGMSRSANKYDIEKIIAEVCWNEATARHAKEHSNANVLCIGQAEVTPELAEKMVSIWLKTPYIPEERHERRYQKTIGIQKLKSK